MVPVQPIPVPSSPYLFRLDIRDVLDEAFERCGINPESPDVRRVISARRSLNLLFVDWANIGVNQWRIERINIPLSQGVASYFLPDATIDLLDTTVDVLGSEMLMVRIGRSEYMAYPNKLLQGRPSQFWVDRQISPSIVIYPAPDNSVYAINTYRIRRTEDITSSQQNPLIPYLWQEAMCSGLAYKLATKYAPDRLDMLRPQAEAAFQNAGSEDRERASVWITPDFSNLLR